MYICRISGTPLSVQLKGMPRYVLVDENDGVTVRDGSADGEIHEGYEIKSEDLTSKLPDGSIADKVNATHSAIDNWLEKHSLNPENVSATPDVRGRILLLAII